MEHAESVLCTLALIVESRDPNTHGHCERISRLSRRLGENLGLSTEEVTALRLGGVVHDIGKVKVPDAILLKPGALSKEEWILMREHPIEGERICAPLKSFRLVLPLIRHHHEKRDGSGYPDGLQGDDIPITARILQLVDVYDALKSVRPYKRAMSTTDAIGTMREEVKKSWWDPDVLHAFEDLLEEESPGVQSPAHSDRINTLGTRGLPDVKAVLGSRSHEGWGFPYQIGHPSPSARGDFHRIEKPELDS